MFVQSKRHTPHRIDFADTGMVVHLVEIVGVVGIARHELRSPCWEIPLVFTVVVNLCIVVEEMLVVGKRNLMLRQQVDEQVAEIVIIPFGSDAYVEVAHEEVQRCHLQGVLVVCQIIALGTELINVDIVMTVGIRQCRSNKAGRVETPVGLCQDALT